MSGYIKLLIVCGIIYLIVKFHPQIIDYLVSSSDLTKRIMTKYEIDQLEYQIFQDFTANNIPIPSRNEFQWHDYIREKNKNKKYVTRDPSIDLWGIPYQIKPSTPDLPAGLMIRSAGPDTIFYSDDDLYTVSKGTIGR